MMSEPVVAARYDVTDAAVLPASPAVVWDELVAELHGARRWWVPHNTFERGGARSGIGCDRVGGTVDVTVHPKGVDTGGPKLRFRSITRDVVFRHRMVCDYVAGAFRGTITFTLDELDSGRCTLLTVRWQARPAGWARLLARVVDIGAEHSRATRDALGNLARVLRELDVAVDAVAVPPVG